MLLLPRSTRIFEWGTFRPVWALQVSINRQPSATRDRTSLWPFSHVTLRSEVPEFEVALLNESNMNQTQGRQAGSAQPQMETKSNDPSTSQLWRASLNDGPSRLCDDADSRGSRGCGREHPAPSAEMCKGLVEMD